MPPLAAHHCLAFFSDTWRDLPPSTSTLLPSATKGKLSGSEGLACRAAVVHVWVGVSGPAGAVNLLVYNTPGTQASLRQKNTFHQTCLHSQSSTHHPPPSTRLYEELVPPVLQVVKGL